MRRIGRLISIEALLFADGAMVLFLLATFDVGLGFPVYVLSLFYLWLLPQALVKLFAAWCFGGGLAGWLVTVNARTARIAGALAAMFVGAVAEEVGGNLMCPPWGLFMIFQVSWWFASHGLIGALMGDRIHGLVHRVDDAKSTESTGLKNAV